MFDIKVAEAAGSQAVKRVALVLRDGCQVLYIDTKTSQPNDSHPNLCLILVRTRDRGYNQAHTNVDRPDFRVHPCRLVRTYLS